MKSRFVKFICIVMGALLLCGCAPQSLDTQPTQPDMDQILGDIAQLGSSPDDSYRVWYEIFVYSYCDSNGDGIGDLNGVRSKLDELEAMGINGIWLMPIHPSTSYHKYNVSDYYKIDPQYGTLEDFEALLAECESRGIRVIMDLVVNHSGSDHKWFRELCTYLRSLPQDYEPSADECQYVEYYNLSNQPQPGYNPISGTNFYYESRFSTDMPDLNLDSPKVRQEIRDIMQFWLDKGVSGFRLDAAKEFWSGNVQKNVEVLSFLQDTARSIDPDVYMVAEVWDNSQIKNYYAGGFTSLFNFPFGDSNGKICEILRFAGNENRIPTYATALEKTHADYSAFNPNYIDAPFLSNHDVGRIAGFVGRNEQKTKLAGAMNIFMSGSVFIYYGEEIGMVSGGSEDPSKRAPMYWNPERNNGTTMPPPGCKLPEEYPFGSLQEQREDPNSIYNYYRQAIAIRQALPVISHGVPTAEKALNVGCVSALRKTWNEQSCIILMNINTEAAQVDLSAYADWKLVASLSADGEAITLDGNTLQLSAFGVAILIPQA